MWTFCVWMQGRTLGYDLTENNTTAKPQALTPYSSYGKRYYMVPAELAQVHAKVPTLPAQKHLLISTTSIQVHNKPTYGTYPRDDSDLADSHSDM